MPAALLPRLLTTAAVEMPLRMRREERVQTPRPAERHGDPDAPMIAVPLRGLEQERRRQRRRGARGLDDPGGPGGKEDGEGLDERQDVRRDGRRAARKRDGDAVQARIRVDPGGISFIEAALIV